MGEVEAVTSTDGVGEDGIWTSEETIASPFSSCNFHLLGSKASWERGFFFIPIIHTYFSLLYYVAISAPKKKNLCVSYREKERWEVTRIRWFTFFFLTNLFQDVFRRLGSKETSKQMTRIDQVVKILDLSSKGKGSLNPSVIWTLHVWTIRNCKIRRYNKLYKHKLEEEFKKVTKVCTKRWKFQFLQ